MHKLVVAAFLLSSFAIAQNAGGDQNPFHWTGTLESGKTLAVKNVSGDVNVEASSGNQVDVTARKHGAGSNRVRIDVVPGSDGVAICAIFPDGEGGPASSCETGTEWSVHRNSNGRGDNPAVDFTVRMPRDARLIVRDVNGSVKATGLGEVADASTVNGSVDVATAQWARLTTVNGAVNGKFGRADWNDQLSITTVNGDINLDVPADFSADFEFNAVNGDFNTDLQADIQDRSTRAWGPKHVRGTIGSGGRQLKLHTVNGSVHLNKGTL